MTPERPRGADAKKAAVEASKRVSRKPVTSAPDTAMAGLYAAVDLGTNSCRMLIAQPRGSQFSVVDSFSKTVQLGVGLEASGKLSRASMARTVQALRICQKKIEKHGVRNMRLVATEACRRASNGAEFIQRVYRELLKLARKDPLNNDGWMIYPMPKQHEIARRAATTRETPMP